MTRSVIILDECQCLPQDLLMPTCQMLKQVAEVFRSTIIFCTATQPNMVHEKLGKHQVMAQEIIPEKLDLFARLKRVQIAWPKSPESPWSWSQVAEHMLATSSALCVVNTKDAAKAIYVEMKLRKSNQHIYHLSTNMCALHRKVVLAKVKTHLEKAEPVYLVSTQLIEAGVDIDFPVLYRELAPFESIIQAAGRCNREGRLPEHGQVIVFRSIEEKLPPDRWYKSGTSTVKTILEAGNTLEIDNPQHIQEYFSRLYFQGDLDEKKIISKRESFQFESCAKEYRLIEQATVPVVIATWGEHAQQIEQRLNDLRQSPNRATFRALVPYQVNLFRNALSKLPQGTICPLNEYIDLLIWYGKYDEELGLVPEMPLDDMII